MTQRNNTPKKLMPKLKLRQDQYGAFFALMAGCDIIHDKNCRRCKQIKKEFKRLLK